MPVPRAGGRGRGRGRAGRGGWRSTRGNVPHAGSGHPCEGFLKWFDPAKGFGFVRLIRPDVATLADNHVARMQLYSPIPCPDDVFVHVTGFGTALYEYGLDPHLSGRPHDTLSTVLGRLVHFRLGYNERGSCCEDARLAELPHAVTSQLELAAAAAAAAAGEHHSNAIGRTGAPGVGAIVVPPGLRCTFDDTSAAALGAAMSRISGITQIDLAGCSCTSVGLRALCARAGESLRQLRSIDLSDQWLLAAGATTSPGTTSLGSQLQAEARTVPGFRPSTMPVSALRTFLLRQCVIARVRNATYYR